VPIASPTVTVEESDRDPIVQFIAGNPGMAAKLLGVHTDDGTGHCRTCVRRQGGAAEVWPCPLHGYASASRELTRRELASPSARQLLRGDLK
jgi:hypothetical protein